MAASSGWDPGLPPSAEDGRPTVPTWMGGVGIGQLQILSLHATEADKKLSPFIVGKSMEDLVGEIESTTTENNGTKYVLRVRDAGQAKKLLNMKALFDGTAVTVELHPVLNKRRCVISCREIINETDDELLKWMAKDGVVGVKRFTRMQDGVRVNTPTITLTINGTAVPEHIKVGPLRIKTRIYIPDPMICYRCFEYGHSKFRCKSVARCRNCSKAHDLESECGAAPFCLHCQGQHGPASRTCPVYVTEKEITRLRFTKGITYQEAMKQVKAGGGSYAAVSQVQQRLVNARETSQAADEINAKDDLIKQLQDTIVKLTTRIEQLETKQRAKKEKKRAKHAKEQKMEDSCSEMETDSSAKQTTSGKTSGSSAQVVSSSSKASAASSQVSGIIRKSSVSQGQHKRHYTTEIEPPILKKNPVHTNIIIGQMQSPKDPMTPDPSQTSYNG